MKWFGLVLLGIAGFVSVLIWTLEGGYEVDGVPFRTWVAQHPDFNIEDPLAALGTNSVPQLTMCLRSIVARGLKSFNQTLQACANKGGCLMARISLYCCGKSSPDQLSAMNFWVKFFTRNPAEIAIHQERSGRNDIGTVVFLCMR